MAAVMLRPQYGDFFGPQALPVLEKVFFSELEQSPMIREKLLQVLSSDRDIAQVASIHDVPLFRQMQENEEYTYGRGKQGASKTYTHLKWGLGVSISEEAMEDGKFNMIADQVRKLAKSGKVTQEINGISLFNNAFTTTVGSDGLAILSNAHTLPSGGTFSNVLSTPADLSPTMVDELLTGFSTQFVGDTGIVYGGIQPKYLLVHESQKRYAAEILKSDLRADTADNNMNSLKQSNIEILSSPYLTDEDATILLADPSQHGGKIWVRKALGQANKAEFDTDTIKYKASFRESLGFDEAYGIFGTPGAP